MPETVDDFEKHVTIMAKELEKLRTDMERQQRVDSKTLEMVFGI